MQESELDSIFDSYVYNGVRLLAEIPLHTKIWVTLEGPEVGEFEDDIGFILEYSETILAKQSEISENRKKYINSVQELYDLVSDFYHNVVYKNLDMKVKDFINQREWKHIQNIANSLYEKIKEENWWKENIIQ
jgi:hypothetical protein